MRVSRLIFVLVVLTGLASCAVKSTSVGVDSGQLVPPLPGPAAVLPEVSLPAAQLASVAVSVSDVVLLPLAEQLRHVDRARKSFFAPWHMERTSLSPADAFWGTRALAAKSGYAENLRPFPPQRWASLSRMQDMERFPLVAVPGIVIRNTSVRIMPTLRPFFLDPALAGEGFPFDYFQNSALWVGTPILVAHVSTDRSWYFVETAVVSGWVPVEDVGLADAAFRSGYERGKMAALMADDIALLDRQGHYFGRGHIGALFPVRRHGTDGWTLAVPARDPFGRAVMVEASVASGHAVMWPLALTSRRVAGLADAMAGQQYGWGGLFENRDCSSTMRDLFLPFGIWLPRNSSQQARHGGRMISLEGMDAEDKLQALRMHGVPFATLISLTGHIGLYLGLDAQGEPLLLHNVWGVRTKSADGREGRAVIGGLAITTLRPGEERSDVRRNAFLDRVRALTLMTVPLP